MAKTVTLEQCSLCGKSVPKSQLTGSDAIRAGLREVLQKKRPDWKEGEAICHECLGSLRSDYVQELLVKDKGELDALEKEVIDSLKKQELIAENINQEFDQNLSTGQRVADKVAEFGGSWTFIISFGTVLAIWIMFNSAVKSARFDPFPFILLNLVLSCLAAIQAPIIMMSQNRQEAKDRLRSEHDYMVNLKAELEVRQLHEKLDHLLNRQMERLLEVQQIQIQMLEDLKKG